MKNEVIKAILNRRSYRRYKPEQISRNELSAIIECGLYAPSALNTQNWHFTVVQNGDLIQWMNEQIRGKLSPESVDRMTKRNNGNPDFSVFYYAPTVVIVSGKEGDTYSPINISFATQNICLAAESLDIGSCIIGMAALLFNDSKAEEYISELGIPNGYKPYYAICLGYKDDFYEAPDRVGGKVNYIS